jgi:hypothetical protein
LRQAFLQAVAADRRADLHLYCPGSHAPQDGDRAVANAEVLIQ